jgi:hypothetical protein
LATVSDSLIDDVRVIGACTMKLFTVVIYVFS